MDASFPRKSLILLIVEQSAALLIGIWAFCASFGWSMRIVNPNEFKWMLGGDWSFMLMGWLSYLGDAWTWPLGKVQSYLYPMDLNLATTDSIPWWSMVAKLWFGTGNEIVQPFGLWFLLCFVLGAQFSWLLARRFLTSGFSRLAFVLIAVTPPILFNRIGHPALCAHWLILATLWSLTLSPRNRVFAFDMVLSFLAAATHPYFIPMVVGGLMIKWLMLGFRRETHWRNRMYYMLPRLLTLVLVSGLTLAMIGLFGSYRFIGGPISIWTADVLSFLQPMGHGNLGNRLGLAPFGSGEGFGYLGAGVLASLMIGMLYLIKPKSRLEWGKVTTAQLQTILIYGGVLFIWSLGEKIQVAGFTVATLHRLYEPFYSVLGVFRCAGRFLWPAAYICMLLAVVFVERWSRGQNQKLVAGLILLLGIQMYDVSRLFRFGGLADQNPGILVTDEWRSMTQGAKSLVMLPAQIENTICNDPAYRNGTWVPLGLLAHQLGLDFNSGGSANPPDAPAREYCTDWGRRMRERAWSGSEVYIIEPKFLESNPVPELVCRQIASYHVCRLPLHVSRRGE